MYVLNNIIHTTFINSCYTASRSSTPELSNQPSYTERIQVAADAASRRLAVRFAADRAQSEGPTELPDVSFREQTFQDVMSRLRATHGEHISIGSNQSIPPAATSPTPAPTPTETSVPATDLNMETDLDTLFPKEAALLNNLNDSTHHEGYKSCFRIRLYNSIRQRYPGNSAVTDEDLSHWLGFGSLKTFRNIKSRHKTGMEALNRLGQESLGGSKLFERQVLLKILTGPLEVLPGLETDRHMDQDEESEAAILAKAI